MLFLLVLLVHSSLALNCSGRCCHWYHEVPGNDNESTIAVGGAVELRCGIYVPRSNNVTVRWYRSTLEQEEVEAITNHDSISQTFSNTSFGNGMYNGLYQDDYTLHISNFNNSDSGRYWCQITSKPQHMCFSSSTYVNITTVETNGTVSPQPLVVSTVTCAETNDTSSCLYKSTITSQQTPFPTPPTNTDMTAMDTNPSPSPSPQLSLCSGDPSIQNLEFAACLGVTVPAAGLVLIVAVNIICCIGICLCWRKQKRKAVLNIAEVEEVNQNTTQESSDTNQALPRKKKVHQYEDVESPQAITADKEETLLTKKTSTSSKIADEISTTTDQDEAKIPLDTTEENPSDVHTYETVSLMGQSKLTSSINQQKQSQTESVHTRYDSTCENKVSKKTQRLSSQNDSSADNQYSVLHHSASVQNTVKKADGDEDAAAQEDLYSKPHTFSFSSSSTRDPSTTVKNEYENFGQVRHRTLSQKQQNSIKKESSAAGDPEYHVLEDISTQNTPAPSTSPKYDVPFSDTGSQTGTPKVVKSIGPPQEKHQETSFGSIKKKEGPEGVFDDPLYSVSLQKAAVNEPELPFDKLTAEVHEVWLGQQ